MKYAPYSYSRISTYLQCPRRFFFKYIEGYSEPPTEAMEFGKLVHETVSSVIEYKDYPDSFYDLNEKDQAVVDKMLDTALNFRRNIGIIYEYGCEIGFGLDKNLETVDFASQEAIFRGVIDYLILFDDFDKYAKLLVDWKTGYSQPDKLQLEFYSLVFKDDIPKKAVKGAFVNLRTGKVEIVEPRENITEIFWNTIETIENDEAFEPKEGSWCKYCAFKDICKGGCENE